MHDPSHDAPDDDGPGHEARLTGNLFTEVPAVLAAEHVDRLVEAAGARLERIVSTAHHTPPGEWYDQATREWVVLLRGRAGIRFVDCDAVTVLEPGDWIDIAPHRRHRVEWTHPTEPTIWLALYYR
jgi:cupin 2 domain-containing protein